MSAASRLLPVSATFLLIFSLTHAEPNELLTAMRNKIGDIQLDDAFSTKMKIFSSVPVDDELYRDPKKTYHYDRWFDNVHSFYTKEEKSRRLHRSLSIPLQHDENSLKGKTRLEKL